MKARIAVVNKITKPFHRRPSRNCPEPGTTNDATVGIRFLFTGMRISSGAAMDIN
jgi:hypothetical protein